MDTFGLKALSILLPYLWPQQYDNGFEINLTQFELLESGHNVDNRLYYCTTAILQHDTSWWWWWPDHLCIPDGDEDDSWLYWNSVEARCHTGTAGYLFINSVRGWIFHRSRRGGELLLSESDKLRSTGARATEPKSCDKKETENRQKERLLEAEFRWFMKCTKLEWRRSFSKSRWRCCSDIL